MAPEETRTPVSAKRADKVRAFYESHPYPAPLRDLDRHRELYRDPDRRRAWSLLLWPTQKPQANREILVAGCGTSQAAIHALREPDARITAIDISENSLRHTRELQRKYALRNLDLHRLAIEEVGELGRSFDQIVCTGVLAVTPATSKQAGILLAPVPRQMSALTRQKSTLFQWLAVPLWVPTGKDSVPTDSGHSVRVLLDPAARLELGARWVNPSSLRRWPTEVTPMLIRSSAVSFGSTSVPISLSRNADT
jgi:SAM-dependent methyltransferase